MLKIILILFFFFFHAHIGASEKVEIFGAIMVNEGTQIPEGGFDVVLLKFIVNDQGGISTSGPQGRVKSQQDGSFLISQIPRELKAAFRIGTRVEGSLHQSNVLFMNKSVSKYQIDLVVPRVSDNVEVLKMEKVSLIFERDHGKVRVTEVWEIKNPTRDRVDSIEKGFPIKLPNSISDFVMPDPMGQPGSDFSLGINEVEVKRIFPPGISQLIFQYTVSSFLGQANLVKTFGDSFEKVMVFTPVDLLQVSSEQLKYQGNQKLHQTVFNSWQGKTSDAAELEINISEVPIKLLDYSFIILILLILLSLCVVFFYRFRLQSRS